MVTAQRFSCNGSALHWFAASEVDNRPSGSMHFSLAAGQQYFTCRFGTAWRKLAVAGVVASLAESSYLRSRDRFEHEVWTGQFVLILLALPLHHASAPANLPSRAFKYRTYRTWA